MIQFQHLTTDRTVLGVMGGLYAGLLGYNDDR